MGRRQITIKDVQNPSRILNNIISDYVDGSLGGDERILYRAVVVKIDNVGGQLQKDPQNPQNSIIARVITDGKDSCIPDEDLSVFWPLFPFDLMPIKESEHVYVMFEDPMKRSGLWLTRIPEPLNVNNPNLVPGIDKYKEEKKNNLTDVGIDKAINNSAIAKSPIVSNSFDINQKIPSYSAKVGDRVIEGSNNTAIILTDDKKQQPNSGVIDIVAGRDADVVNFKNDKSRIFVSMKSDVDGDFEIKVGEGSGISPSIVVKSDQIRIVAVKGMKLVVEGGDVYIDGDNIHLGPDSNGESAVLGDSWKTYFTNFLNTWALTHIHQTAVGPTIGPATPSPPPFPANALSKTVKVKG